MNDGLPAALLLDLDGTLVDSEPIHRRAYRSFFADRGWEVADLSLFTGRRAEDVFVAEPGPWSGSDPLELKTAIVALIGPEAVPEPVAGARALVEAAAERGVPVAVVTSADSDWTERALTAALEVRHHVDLIVTARDVADGKPHPAGFTLACDRLGVEARRCVAVEDSPAGVAAALAAGVGQVYGVSTTHDSQELIDAGATDVLTDLTGLAQRIGLTA